MKNDNISNINHLAKVASEGHSIPVETIDNLASILADIVGDVKQITAFDPSGNAIDGERKLPNVLCGSSKCTIVVERNNGFSKTLSFPSTIDALDEGLIGLGEKKTDDELAFNEFSDALIAKLDGYGHLNYTVGSENWLACGDAVLGRFNGKFFLAWHVVVDCESGGFCGTSEKHIVPVEGKALSGILECYEDLYYECGNIDEDDEGYDVDGSQKSIEAFDAHVLELWKCEECDISLDWGAEDLEQGIDPVRDGWVGHDGRP